MRTAGYCGSPSYLAARVTRQVDHAFEFLDELVIRDGPERKAGQNVTPDLASHLGTSEQ